MGYELSQRSRHITQVTGTETRHDRAIFCTRTWKPSDASQAGWTRTNLISKDSQRASFGMYLTYGVTGLMFLIMNEGHQIGRHVQLNDPVAAMRAFSLDPWMKTTVLLANGKSATALDIQRAYLRELTPHAESGDYPDWAGELLLHWSRTLDQLESNPLELADRLDTYLKLTVLDHQIVRAGHSWPELHRALGILNEMRNTRPETEVRALLANTSTNRDGVLRSLYRRLAKSGELKQVDLDCLQFAVRLQALELNYHELGGWFDQLAAARKIDPVVVTSREVERAVHHPPAGGRAEARAKSIAELHRQSWRCDWQYVVNFEEEKWIDLRDPFSNEWEIVPLNSSFPDGVRVL